MRYQQDLQVAVRERQRRLMVVPWTNADHEVRLVVDWIEKQPALCALLAEAAEEEPDLDLETFFARFNRHDPSWPTRTEGGRATLIWKIMRGEGDASGNTVPDLAHRYSTSSSLQDRWRKFAADVLQPLFDFLSERVGAQSSVLYVLERYVRRVEWFDREDLYARYLAGRRNGEEVYNLDLQRFLFLEGDYVTHAKPRSASGEADLVGDLDTEDPLVCDGKIFDGDGRGKHYIAKGFHQIIKYAQDYNKNVAYLVVFNITDRLLVFPTEGAPGTWPPYAATSGVRVYFVGVRAFPPATTASKSGKANPVQITHDDLVNPDAGP